MELSPVEPDGFQARCPGCGAVQVFMAPPDGYNTQAFIHDNDDCPVHAKIKKAIAHYERTVVKRG